MKRIILILLILVLGALSLSACNFSLAADVTPPPGYQPPPPSTVEATTGPLFPVVPPDPAQGAAIYAEKCAPCHGVAGMGDGPNAAALPNPVTALGSPDVARQASPARWFQVVSEGNLERFMPPFRSLSDRQRWDVVAYAFALSNPPDELARAAGLWSVECAACHGPTGIGNGPQASNLNLADLTDQERMVGRTEADFYARITGGGEGMPAFGERLSDEDRWALAGFTRFLTFASTRAEAGLIPPPSTPVASGSTPAATEALAATAELSATQVISPSLTGAVSGLIATAGGEPAKAGVEVNLHAFSGMELVFTQTVTLGADGTYLFNNLQMQPGLAFLSTVDYDGVIYGSEVAVAETASDQLDLPIQVYESITDTSVLSVDRTHYFFEFVDENTMRVLELYIISNTGDKTVIAPQAGEPVLTFDLPPEAANLQFEDGALGGRYIETPGGFGDTAPIRPGAGNFQILFTYELPYDRSLELVRTTPLMTQAVVILAPQDGIKIKGENLQAAGTRDIQGVQYQMYNAPAMGQNSQLRLTISGKPGAGGIKLSSAPTANLVIGLSALGLVLVAAGAWLFTRNRRGAGQEDAPAAPAAALDTREAVMDAILALDDLFQEGKLPEEAYRQRRAELKSRLKELVGE